MLTAPHYKIDTTDDPARQRVTVTYPGGSTKSFAVYGSHEVAERSAKRECEILPETDEAAKAGGWIASGPRVADSTGEEPEKIERDTMSIENDSSPTARAERARYLGAIPGALWERMTRPERQVFTGGTVTEVRALAARLGIKPESRRTAARTKAPTDPVTATACSIARTGDMGALTRFLNAAKPTTREVPPVADAPKVEDMDPAVARAFGFLPAYEHQSEAVHYPAAGHAERVANRGA